MSRFFKFLILVAAVINLAFIFVFDGKIPSSLPIPFLEASSERAEISGEDELQIAEKVILAEEEGLEETMLPQEEPEEEEAAAEEPEEEEAVPRCRIISTDGSNIRSGPGTNFDIVTSYPYDTVFTLTGEPEIGWYPIMAEDGTEGYIFENQIELLDEETAEDAPLTDEMMQQ